MYKCNKVIILSRACEVGSLGDVLWRPLTTTILARFVFFLFSTILASFSDACTPLVISGWEEKRQLQGRKSILAEEKQGDKEEEMREETVGNSWRNQSDNKPPLSNSPGSSLELHPDLMAC